jgi:hypothetical protein
LELDLSICFLHFRLVPVLIFCCGETGFPVFFCLPVIAVGGGIVPVLCAIKYYLAYSNSTADI